MKATDTLIDAYAKRGPRGLLADCEQMILCIAGFDGVFTMSPAQAVELSRNLDDDWLSGFNRTFELLCLAGADRGIDLQQFKQLALSTYSFWQGCVPMKEMESIQRRLFVPCISAMYDLKRALIVECGKSGEAACHDRLKRSALWRTALAFGVLVVTEAVIGFLVWRYGEGSNLLQKLTNAWSWPVLGFAATAILYPFIMGRERMRVLKWWKGEIDELESKSG